MEYKTARLIGNADEILNQELAEGWAVADMCWVGNGTIGASVEPIVQYLLIRHGEAPEKAPEPKAEPMAIKS